MKCILVSRAESLDTDGRFKRWLQYIIMIIIVIVIIIIIIIIME